MTIEETLNEFQKRRLSERLKLNFYEELKKSKKNLERKQFFKKFLNHIDIFVTELYNNGVIFYSFNIVMPFLREDDPELWKIIHLQVEDWVNTIKIEIELIEFLYLSIQLQIDKKSIFEENSENNIKDKTDSELKLPYFCGIIGVRSLIGKNDYHINAMKKFFNLNHLICTVGNFNSVDDIKNYWYDMIKDNNLFFHRFTQYSNYYNSLYCDIADFELQYDDVEHIAFGLDENLDSKYNYIKGIEDCNPDEKTIITYLINIYMLKEKLFINKNKIYRKQNNHKLKFIGSVDYLILNNLKIFQKLKKRFPQQLTGLKIPKLFNKAWNLFFADIKKNNHYLPQIKIKKKKKLVFSNEL